MESNHNRIAIFQGPEEPTKRKRIQPGNGGGFIREESATLEGSLATGSGETGGS